MVKSNVRIDLRIPADLKAMFTALCENENTTVSAKLKKFMFDEVQKKLNMSQYRQTQSEYMPRTQKNAPISHSDTMPASTLPQQNKTPVNAQNNEISPLDEFFDKSNGIQNRHTGEINHNLLLSSALNSSKNRQIQKKKKR